MPGDSRVAPGFALLHPGNGRPISQDPLRWRSWKGDDRKTGVISRMKKEGNRHKGTLEGLCRCGQDEIWQKEALSKRNCNK